MKAICVTISIALGISLAGCSGRNGADIYGSIPSGPPSISVPASVAGTQGSNYTISVFAKAPGALEPDDMVQMGSSVFVICQDTNVNPDGTLKSGVTSAQAEVVEYDLKGNVQQTFERARASGWHSRLQPQYALGEQQRGCESGHHCH